MKQNLWMKLFKAPKSWKNWIKYGNSKIDTLRRNVSKLQVLSTTEQSRKNSKEFKTLQEIYKFYSAPSAKKI